jgi:hypothetical protein
MAAPKRQPNNPDLITRMITPLFRLSHPHLFKAQAPNPNDKPKFQATMLLKKGTALMGATLATESEPSRPISLKDIIRNAKIQKYGAQENWPDDLKSCVADGDDKSFHKNGEKEGYKGHYVIKMTSNEDQRPGVVNRKGVPITEPGDIYPGCFCKAYVYARVWEHPTGGHGVQLILDHIQKVEDGPSFGGKKPVEQVFGAIDDAPEETEEHDFM